jgi:uncharacterized membrane protein
MRLYAFLLVGLVALIAVGLLLRRLFPGGGGEMPKRVGIVIFGVIVAIVAIVAGMYVLDIGYQWGKPKEVVLDVPIEEWQKDRLARGAGFMQTSKAMSKGAQKKEAVSSAASLVTLLQKLEMLDRDGSLALEPQQARTILAEIEGLETQVEWTDDDVRAKSEKILGALNDRQRQAVQSAATPASESEGGAAALDDANPFQNEAVAGQLKNLRERLTERAGSNG